MPPPNQLSARHSRRLATQKLLLVKFDTVRGEEGRQLDGLLGIGDRVSIDSLWAALNFRENSNGALLKKLALFWQPARNQGQKVIMYSGRMSFIQCPLSPDGTTTWSSRIAQHGRRSS